jgi:transcriptional regulator GlxA family with amidase domain
MGRTRSRTSQQVRFLLAGAERKMMPLFGGLTVKPDISYDELPPLDLLILPAIWRSPRATINRLRPWLATLSELAAGGTRICTVGTASCLLAEAGLLKARPATTHWNYFDQFSLRYPDVELKTRHLITQSDNIYCAGSVNSIADLMVHIVEDWYGSAIARSIENQFSPEIRRPFRAAAYQSEPQSLHHDESILEAQQWLRDRVSEPVSIAHMAETLGMSRRTLHRRFRLATGSTPLAYLQNLRIAEARDLLRVSNLSVSEIAWQLGLQDVSHFSRLFRQQVGMTPLRYRQAVRGKLFAPRDN